MSFYDPFMCVAVLVTRMLFKFSVYNIDVWPVTIFMEKKNGVRIFHSCVFELHKKITHPWLSVFLHDRRQTER
jgi:hypothetical protein